MKKIALAAAAALFFTACKKCVEPGIVCTQEFRMIMLKVESPAKVPVALDSFYTLRISNSERIQAQQGMQPGYYVVLDDSYQPRLKGKEEDFRFLGWRGGQQVVNEAYRIAADNCHISKRSGADSVTVQ